MLVPRTCTLWRLVHASLSNCKNPLRFIRSGKYFTWQIIMECQLRLYLSPPPQQRGPRDSPRQNPGENTAQNMCFVQCTMVALSQLYYYRVEKVTNSVLFTTCSPQNQNHLSWDYSEEIQKWSKCFLFQKVNLSVNFTVRFQLPTPYVSFIWWYC